MMIFPFFPIVAFSSNSPIPHVHIVSRGKVPQGKISSKIVDNAGEIS